MIALSTNVSTHLVKPQIPPNSSIHQLHLYQFLSGPNAYGREIGDDLKRLK